MSQTPPQKVYNCSLCSYTTNKKYNLERHTGTVHSSKTPKVAEKWPKVATGIKCEQCFKVFAKQA